LHFKVYGNFQGAAEDARGAVAIAASLRAYPAQPKGPRRSIARVQLPKEVFWLVFKFWRSDRDAPYS